MSNLVWQTWVGTKVIPDYVKLSRNHFQRYAEIHNARYLLSTGNYFGFDFKARHFNHNSHAVLSKLRPLFDEIFNEYDNILIVDTDVLINNFDLSIFDYARTDISGTSYLTKPEVILDAVKSNMNVNYYPEKLGLKGFALSGGMLVLSKAFRTIAKNTFVKPVGDHQTDENYYRQNINNSNMISYMDFRWNFNIKLHEYYRDSYFLHFHGDMKKYMNDFYNGKKITLNDDERIIFK